MSPAELEALIASDPLRALGVLIEEAGLTVRLGLSPEQVRDVAVRVVAHEDWTTIGRAIGWDPHTLREWWERAAARIVLDALPVAPPFGR